MSDLNGNEKSRRDLIVLSAGGTGGHMFPAAALAQDLKSRGYEVMLITDTRGSKFSHFFDGVQIHVNKAGSPSGGLKGKIQGLLATVGGILQARKVLKKYKPRVVVGFGGYPSFPAVYVAQKMKIPTVIHEQNAVLGKANAYLAPKVDRIALSMPIVEGMEESDAVRAIFTGNPVRESIAALYNKPFPALHEDGDLKITVIGGSLGARVFAEVLPKAFERLPEAYKQRLLITQQCREEDIDGARADYNAAGIRAELSTFFDDMASLLADTHLVIARSGASTVAEVTVAGRPAIFVPYPFHKDQQQKINADTVADAGGAWVMTQDGFTEDALLSRIENFLQNPETLFRAAENARSCAKPDAARRLGNLVTAMASGWDKDAHKTFDLTQGRRG